MLTKALIPLAIFCAVGCGGGTELDVTLRLAPDVDPLTESRIVVLDVEATGDETYSDHIALDRAPLAIERFVYHPLSTSHHLELTISGLNSASDVLAVGSTMVTLSGVTTADVTLEASSPSSTDMAVATPNDMAMDDDMETYVDLSHPDLTVPPDLAPACPSDATCFDFEAGLGNTQLLGSKNCAIVTTHASRGTHSLECQGTTPSWVGTAPPISTSAGQVGFRAHVLIAAPTTVNGANYVGFSSSYLNPGDYVAVGEASGKIVGLDYTSSASTNVFDPTSVTDHDSKWHCVEILFTPPSSATLYIDGTSVVGPVTNVLLGSSTPGIVMGLPIVMDTTAGDFYDVFIDDVVVGYGRQGCN